MQPSGPARFGGRTYSRALPSGHISRPDLLRYALGEKIIVLMLIDLLGDFRNSRALRLNWVTLC